MSARVSMMHNNMQNASKSKDTFKSVKDEIIVYETILLRRIVVLYTLLIGRGCSLKIIFLLIKSVLSQFVLFFNYFEQNKHLKSPIINY